MSSAPSEESTRSDTERGIALPLQEGTPLDLVLRDCGIVAVAIVGVALEAGIEPTVRHAADLGYIPVSSAMRAAVAISPPVSAPWRVSPSPAMRS
jgi:nicotinamidase-related amidase